MVYYILYPDKNKHGNKVKIVKKRPDPVEAAKNGWAFAEGSFKTKKEVIIRLNMLNIKHTSRPKGY